MAIHKSLSPYPTPMATTEASTPATPSTAMGDFDLIGIVFDESGSRTATAQASVDGLNEFIGGQKEGGREVKFQVVCFDTQQRNPDEPYSPTSHSLPPPPVFPRRQTAVPFGYRAAALPMAAPITPTTPSTPLKTYAAGEMKPFVVGMPGSSATHWGFQPRGGTALCDAIGDMITSMKKVPTRGTKVLVIETDGEENASSRYTSKAIKVMVEECQGEGWTVIFLASNLDATETGASFGVAAAQCVSYNQHTSSTGVWQATTACVQRARTGDHAGYTALERDISAGAAPAPPLRHVSSPGSL